MHKYYYSGTQLLAEEWGNHLIIFLYDAGGSPLGMKYRTTSYESSTYDTYWYELDLQGDVVGIYGDNGTKYATYRYDAWGNHTVTYYNGGATIVPIANNPFRYRGYYYDADLGLYYLRSRYYDSNTGRFINADKYASTGSGFTGYNMYAYCNNNPVMYTDPEGNNPLLVVGGVALVVLLLTSCGLKDAIEFGEAAKEFSEDLTAYKDYKYEYSSAVVEYNTTNEVPQNNNLVECFDGDEQKYRDAVENDADFMKHVIDEEHMNDVDYLVTHFRDWAQNGSGKITVKSMSDATKSGLSLYEKIWNAVIGVAD